MELAFSVLRIGLAVYIGLSLFLFFRQSHYVYYPDKQVGATPRDVGIAYEDVELLTEDGETLGAWYVPAESTNAAITVLLCHGNAGDIGDRVGSVVTFHNLGYNLLVFDYRGYGRSTGRPSEKGTYMDADAAWRFLTKKKQIPAASIIVFGRSLGGAIGAWLAEHRKPAALVLESAFTSAPDMAKGMFPFLPSRLICRFRYDTLSRLANIDCPIFVAHGTEDEMIPFRHGQRLFEAASDPKIFFQLNGGHNSGGIDGDPAYQETFVHFVSSAITKQSKTGSES